MEGASARGKIFLFRRRAVKRFTCHQKGKGSLSSLSEEEIVPCQEGRKKNNDPAQDHTKAKKKRKAQSKERREHLSAGSSGTEKPKKRKHKKKRLSQQKKKNEEKRGDRLGFRVVSAISKASYLILKGVRGKGGGEPLCFEDLLEGRGRGGDIVSEGQDLFRSGERTSSYKSCAEREEKKEGCFAEKKSPNTENA